MKAPRVDESLLNTLLCFTTTDSLTWQRTELHEELFNLRHMVLWNSPTKAINTNRVIPRNLIEATLIAFLRAIASLSKQRKTKTQIAENPAANSLIGEENQSDFKPVQFSIHQLDFKLKQLTNFEA